MGIFDKMSDFMKMDDDYDDEDDEELEDEEETPKKRNAFFKSKDDDEEAETSSKITPMRGSSKRTNAYSANSTEVKIIKPASFDDVRDICDAILMKKVVILNMEGLDLAVAQRIIDFMSGACYAIEGKLQKVSNFIFAITPKNIEISGDLQGLMESANLSGLKTGF